MIPTNTSKSNQTSEFQIVYTFPGLVTGCSAVESVLLSTLQCFYADSNCSILLLEYMFKNTEIPFDPLEWPVTPLNYDSEQNHYSPNNSIGEIVRRLMIEEWNPVLNYKLFFESCLPNYCIYFAERRTRNALEVVITLASMFGGLTRSLHLITPILVKCISHLFEYINRKRQRRFRNKGNYE